MGSTNKAYTASDWETTDTIKQYGSSSDLWDETWIIDDINNSNFGIVLSSEVIAFESNGVALVDHIQITVYYTEPIVGYRVANSIDLSSIVSVFSSDISWSETKPANTEVNVYTKITMDGITPPLASDFILATNGGDIPEINVGDDLTGKYLWVKEELISIDNIAIPKISSLSINIEESADVTVDVIENTTVATRYIPFPDDRDKWIDKNHILSLNGNAGDYCFQLGVNSEMMQILYASDIGAQPANLQLIGKFKLEQAQDSWDANVLGMIGLIIYYTDGTKDSFLIPCVKGVTHADRTLINWWILVQNTCAVNALKTLDYVKVYAKTINCSNILDIDYIELRKEV